MQEFEVVISLRIASSDKKRLDSLALAMPRAKVRALAREAMRLGLDVLESRISSVKVQDDVSIEIQDQVVDAKIVLPVVEITKQESEKLSSDAVPVCVGSIGDSGHSWAKYLPTTTK